MKVTTMEVTKLIELYFLHAYKKIIYIYIYRQLVPSYVLLDMFTCFSPKECHIVSPSLKLIFQS